MKIKQKQFLSLNTHLQCGEDKNVVAAKQLLRGTGFNLLDAVRIALELIEATGGSKDWRRLRAAINAGAEQLQLAERSISFSEAVQSCLAAKAHRSERTLQDIRQNMKRMMKDSPELAQQSMRSLRMADCERMLRLSFAHSAAGFVKARANLSGVFNHAYRLGYCAGNPITHIAIPALREREIRALSLTEIRQLISTAARPAHRDCQPALGLMLYAGVRPDELRRLSWEDIDWEEEELCIASRHSKTGGARHVPLAAPALRLLRSLPAQERQGSICPPRWRERWLSLRQGAGFDHWVPDVLRHSYASYHAKHHRNLPALQLAMGHRDCRLLLTRYVNLRGISSADAKRFWQAC